jgi:alpha-D-ribose 1-methylphosphonate 5-triphosphate synthase subunit PhnL
MSFKGHVDNGVIVLDKPARLPQGTPVLVQVQTRKKKDSTGIAGIWHDERSANEIIKDIYQSRRSKK